MNKLHGEPRSDESGQVTHFKGTPQRWTAHDVISQPLVLRVEQQPKVRKAMKLSPGRYPRTAGPR